MIQETKVCQNCRQNFPIDPEDFAFYEKIKVPPPTWCPECRMIRRMSFWNERNLFMKKDINGKSIFSAYPEDSPVKVLSKEEWWSDNFDPLSYGRDYDFNKPFFVQFGELMSSVPFPARDVGESVMSDYCNNGNNLKNCYMCFDSDSIEDSLYCVFCGFSRNCMEMLNVGGSESCCEFYSGDKSYRLFYGIRSSNCRDSYFMYGCSDCSNCFGCVNLRHKQYHIWNVPYTKEEYFKKLEEMNVGSHKAMTLHKEKFEDLIQKYPRRYMTGIKAVNSSGDDITRSGRAKKCFEVVDAENVAYSQAIALHVKDSYDYTNWGLKSELMYEDVACGAMSQNIRFSYMCGAGSHNLEYCMSSWSSSDSFGCVGLKSKQYCILNKQYSKDEYTVMREKIVEHMRSAPYIDKLGRTYSYGEFFPPELSPIAINESAAVDFVPDLIKDRAVSYGMRWKEISPTEYKTTLPADNLPDSIESTLDDVTKEVVACVSCKRAYKITPAELRKYREFKLPLPRKCHNCRFRDRIRHRNIPRWYDRDCDCAGLFSKGSTYENTASHFHNSSPCPNKFSTAYPPQKKDVIYCEECYKTEFI